ncbi:hypothetical protein DB34_13770 [Acetobacter pasteurianus]|nr:hypothetical protein DB34_13770 [Acetobacter pasteurianus]
MTNEAIAEAIASRNVDTIVSNIKEANRLFYELGDEIFLATEEANDPVIAQFAASLLLNGIDGYNHATYVDAWGAHPDPEWGTIWGIHKSIRDFTPAFIFKVCMCGDVRFLAVECHAPNRRLPDDLQDRLRARTMIVSGVPTVSFSPTEINTDTDACVLEVNDALHTLAEELLALHGVSQPPRREFRPRVGV